MDKDRDMTEFQELVYRLRHHEHFGRSTKETAAILETSPSSIRLALSNVRRVAPQLFPILSREDWKIWRLWIEYNYTVKQVAFMVSLPFNTVRSKLWRTRVKLGVRIYDPRGPQAVHRRASDILYKASMDGYVKRRF